MKFASAALAFLLVPALNAQTNGRSERAADRYPAPPAVSDWPTDFPAVPRTSSVPRAEAIKPVSVGELLIPPRAAKELERSEKAWQSGDLHSSAQHLEKAVHIYPDYLQAHNLLGTRYMSLRQYKQAVSEFQKATAIDPNSAPTYLSLTVAHFFDGDFAAAEGAGRRALELDPESTATRYVLARSLIQQGRGTPEALELLRQSEAKFPNARLVLALILSERGETPQVIAELQQYLAAPADPENKRRAECWLAELTKSGLPAGCPADAKLPAFR